MRTRSLAGKPARCRRADLKWEQPRLGKRRLADRQRRVVAPGANSAPLPHRAAAGASPIKILAALVVGAHRRRLFRTLVPRRLVVAALWMVERITATERESHPDRGRAVGDRIPGLRDEVLPIAMMERND